MMVDLIHSNGEYPCGKVAFRYDKEHIKEGEMISASRAEYPDGTHPEGGEFIRCGSCNQLIRPGDVDWESWL